MPFYSIKLLAKKEVAKKTMAFFFEKPKNQSTQNNLSARPSSQQIESSGFKFVPGQFIEMHLSRQIYSFSIASSPKEKELMIATRIRPSAFKNALKKLKIANKVKIEGPFGQFVLHKNRKIPAVLLAGGIGITPFRSIIKSFSNRKIALFYSNRKPKDAAFLDELINLKKKNKKFKLIATMTKTTKKEWGGYFGYINPKIIKESVKDWRKAIYYAVGSTGFVQAMANILSEMKIKPEQIKTENFNGY